MSTRPEGKIRWILTGNVLMIASGMLLGWSIEELRWFHFLIVFLAIAGGYAMALAEQRETGE